MEGAAATAVAAAALVAAVATCAAWQDVLSGCEWRLLRAQSAEGGEAAAPVCAAVGRRLPRAPLLDGCRSAECCSSHWQAAERWCTGGARLHSSGAQRLTWLLTSFMAPATLPMMPAMAA
jgi:hypothetical protein